MRPEPADPAPDVRAGTAPVESSDRVDGGAGAATEHAVAAGAPSRGAVAHVAPIATPGGVAGVVCTAPGRDPRCRIGLLLVTVRRIGTDRARGHPREASAVRLAIEQVEPQLRRCAEQSRMDLPQAVTVELRVDAGGAVTSSVGTGRDPAMNRCIADAIATTHGRRWHYGAVSASADVMFSELPSP